MPPRRFSRHAFTEGIIDSTQGEQSFLTEREPFRFRSRSDTRPYTVREGDTLFGLAARAFASLPRPAGLWWIIAEFQPEPIHDPTIQLAVGRVLFIPSERVVQEEVFNENRRSESNVT